MNEPHKISTGEKSRKQALRKRSERLAPYRVLMLEDVGTDAELIQLELQRAGIPFVGRCVKNRNDFVAALKDFNPDIVLSDYLIPGFDALEALDLVKKGARDIPFILVTGTQSEEVAVQCMREGADDYILKSTLKRLPSALQNAIERKEANRERVRALEALRRSEEYFRSLIENALDIILILNPDMTLGYASPSIRALGYTPQELKGKNVVDYISGDDAQEFLRFFHMAFQQAGQPKKAEFVFRHADGTFRVLEAIGKTIQLDAANPGIVLNARDITERKQSEGIIEKLAAFPRFNPYPVFELNASGHLNYWNQAAQELAREAGSAPASLLPTDTLEVIAECLRTGKGNLRRESRIGKRTFSWAYFPIIPSQVVHCYALDITERVALETHLRQVQNLESVGQLAAGIAHDYNNVLTVIQGYSDILLHTQLEGELHESVEQISIAAERAASLTRQLLAFSRKQVMQVQPLDLNATIANVTKRVRHAFGDGIALHFNYSPNLPLVQADPVVIEQILMNLALNARDALPSGGIVSISTSWATMTVEDVQANPEAQEGDFVCLRVSDNGTGIESEVLPRIFEPFFTTKEVGKGCGLGLATVYGTVKQLQGWVDVRTGKGQGTSFQIYLPASKQDVIRDSARMVTDSHSSGNETVLVVEDEPGLRGLVCGILRQHGYRVKVAASAKEAIETWDQSKVDLLFTDLIMPGGMSGPELAERFCAERPSLKVIFTSGYSVDTIPQGLSIKRGLNFLQKPYHPAALVKVIRACLDV